MHHAQRRPNCHTMSPEPKLFATSDLHLGFSKTRNFVQKMGSHPNDWLLLAGDIAETDEVFSFACAFFASRFDRVIWTPGNHDLWTVSSDHPEDVGDKKYQRFVEICRKHNVLTPEDPFPMFQCAAGKFVIAPTFTLYDYSFRPSHVAAKHAVDWAIESGVLCTDEQRLHPHPYASRTEWCHARIQLTEKRLAEAEQQGPLIIVNHFPLRYDLVKLKRIPRFCIWCGTKNTEDWHCRFDTALVVSGHLHIPACQWRNGVRFEEVSFGNPDELDVERTPDEYLREIFSNTAMELDKLHRAQCK